MATRHCAITVGKTETHILGVRFDNAERFGPATLAEMFGPQIPVPTDHERTASVPTVARYLRRAGVEGLRAMLDGSEIVTPAPAAS